MSEIITRRISIPATYAASIQPAKVTTFPIEILDRAIIPYYGVFETDLTATEYTRYFRSTSNIYDIIKVELEFWHNKIDVDIPITSFEFVELTSQPSSSAGPAIVLEIAGGTVWKTQQLHSAAKTKETVILGNGSAATACTWFNTQMSGGLWFGLGIKGSQDAGDGTAELGNLSTLEDEGEYWREADADEIATPPKFIITWQESIDETRFSSFAMRYTTADPTTSQNTPSNSTGGYVAPNEIYTAGQIDEFLNSTQTYIQLSSDTTIAENSGLVQVGPEIARFTIANENTNQLLGVTRGVAPAAYPSSIVPEREEIRFLQIDNLFDTRPTEELVQYRCVAFVVENTSISDVTVYLRQSSTADVQVDVGIETPLFDIREDELDVTVTNSNVFAMSGESLIYPRTGVALLESGSDLYEGGYALIDYDGTSELVLISSCDVSDDQTQATFIADRAFSKISGTLVRILPAPCQRFSNDSTVPVYNSNRFLGFFGDGGSNSPNNLDRDGGNLYRPYDTFYLWIKRTLVSNSITNNATGAIVYIRYTEESS